MMLSLLELFQMLGEKDVKIRLLEKELESLKVELEELRGRLEPTNNNEYVR